MKKILSVIASLAILANTLVYPFAIAYAQEATSTPEPTTEPTATSEATVTSTPTVIPEPTPTQSPSPWTFEKVELNKEYQNDGVTLTFTKLPSLAGSIKIEEITLTEDQIKQTGSLSDKAYDITSDMKDGDFSYNLSLPIPESSKGKEVDVKFAEELSNIASAEKVDNTLTKTDTSVSVANLDHFTIFVVSGLTASATMILVDSLQPNWDTGVYSAYYTGPYASRTVVSPGNTTVHDGREAGIIKAGFVTAEPWDEGILAFKVPNVAISTFAGQVLTYDVQNESGSNPVWARIRLVGGTQYQFVPSPYSAGAWNTVNAATGEWQLMDGDGNATGSSMTLSGVAAANPGAQVDRVYLTLGMGNSYNVSPGVGTVGWVDKATLGGVTYDFVVAGATPTSCTGASITPPVGTTACYSTIQAAIDAASLGDIINVATGTYAEHLSIDKAISIIGADKNTTFIDGGNTGTVVTITADDVIFKGFTVQNSGSSTLADMGIKLDSVSGCTIEDNISTNNANGIGVLVASNNSITNNNVNTNDNYGIAVVAGTNNTIEQNTIIGNGLDAIALENASIVGGPVSMGSTGNFIKGNTINSNRDGIFLGENSDNNQITNGNSITSAVSIGISLWRSGGHTITNNTISNTVTGIRFLGSSDNTITDNTILSNNDGIKIDPSWQVGIWYQSTNNVISGNNISGNSTYGIQADDTQQIALVDATNNWWGDISGPGGEGTGIGVSVSANVTFSPWCLNESCSETSEIYSGGSEGAVLSDTPQDITVDNLVINDIEGEGNIFVAKYDELSDVPSGGTTFGVDNFYYNIDAPVGTVFPINIEINYVDSPNTDPNYLDEDHFSTLYYYNGSDWKDYKLDTIGTTGYAPSTVSIDKSANKISASLQHLTPIVPVLDISPPTVVFSEPVNGSVHNGVVHLKATCDEECDYVNFWWRKSDESYNSASRRYHYVNTNGTTFEWDLNTLNALKADNSTYTMSDGTYYLYAAATDVVGNWAKTPNITIEIDNTAPTVDLIFPIPGSSATSFQAVFSENVVESEAENPANYFLNNWPGAGGSGDLAGDATISYDSISKTSTISFTNPGWSISPEQQWGVENIHDLVGNLLAISPYSEYSTLMITPINPGTPSTGSSPTNLLTQNWIWANSTDIDGSGVKGYWQSIYDVLTSVGGSWSWLGNVLGTSTNLTDGEWQLWLKAEDNAGNESGVVSSSTLTVDSTAPIIASHTDVVVNADSDVSGATVNYVLPTATDNIDISVTVSCTPPSGSFFPLGTTTVTCDATDTAGNNAVSTTFTVTVNDVLAPVTTSSGIDANWHKTNVTVTLACTDANSSCVHTYYTTNGTDPTTASNEGTTFTLSASGVYTIKYFSVDNAGNTETVKTATNTVKIDKQKPSTPAVTQPVANGYINSPTIQTFEWTEATDPTPGSGLATTNKYQYQIDNDSNFSSPERNVSLNETTKTLTSPLSDGIYYIRVRAKDAVGNYSSWSTSVMFTVDTLAPSLSSVNIASNNTNTSFAKVGDIVTLHFFSNEPVKPPTILIEGHNVSATNNLPDNGNEWTANWQMVDGDSEGPISFSIDYVDAVDNPGSTITGTTDESTVVFDETAPTDGSLIINSNDLYTNSRDVNLEISAQDDLSGINQMSIANGGSYQDWESYSTTKTWQLPDTDGVKTVRAKFKDVAGNETPTPFVSDTIILDRVVPASIPTSPVTGYYNVWDGVVSGTASDDRSGVNKVEVSIKVVTPSDGIKYWDGNSWEIGQTWQTTTGTTNWSYTITSPIEGTYTFYSRATDNAGNIESTGVLSGVVYDITSPELVWTSPVEDFIISGTLVILTVETDNLSGIDSVVYEYKRNDGSDTYHVTSSNWDTTDLALDTYTLRATVKDKADNEFITTRQVGVAAVVSNESGASSTYGTATITWTTDRPTKSRVVYDTVSHGSLGVAPNYGYAYSTGTFDSDPKTTSHSVTITGLSDGTVYYYRTISEGSPAAIGDQKSYRTLTIAGASSSSGGATGGQVQGVSTVSSGNNSLGYNLNQNQTNGNEEVLGTEIQNEELSTPKPSLIPEVKGTATNNWNARNIALISFGSALIILALLLLWRKSKK